LPIIVLLHINHAVHEIKPNHAVVIEVKQKI
jgi:hypothetical protein